VGHARLAPEQLADDALDGAAAEDGEGVAAVGGDDAVVGGDGCFEADGDCFLQRTSASIRKRLYIMRKKTRRTWPMARWQNPRMSFALYSASAAISMRRMVCIWRYQPSSWSLVTVTSRSGASHWYARNESSCSLTVKGCDRSDGFSGSCVVSADVWIERASWG
jgi:hypothetical protein